MSTDKKRTSWLGWLIIQGPVAWLLLLFLVLFAILIPVLYLDNRLRTIEEQLNDQTPSHYKIPDLSALATKDVPSGEGVVKKRVYVPIYSHIYYDGGRPLLLEATLSIRNTDTDKPVYITLVRYYDTDGKLAKDYLQEGIKLAPLQTIEFLVKEHEIEGGSGANFIVDWRREADVENPLVESVMVGTHGSSAISFARPGIVQDDGN